MPKYIICGYYCFPKSDLTLNASLSSGKYLLGNRIRQIPRALFAAVPGDILLLRFFRKIVAYGVANSRVMPLASNDSSRPHYLHEILVDRWVRFDGKNPVKGVRVVGVSKNYASPQPPRDVAKEVTQGFAQHFIDEIDARQPQ